MAFTALFIAFKMSACLPGGKVAILLPIIPVGAFAELATAVAPAPTVSCFAI